MPHSLTTLESPSSEPVAAARAEVSPEQRLMLAVLGLARSDACLRIDAAAADRLRARARAWFASEDDSWPMSFIAICHHLGVDPEATRAASLDAGTSQR